MSLIQECLEAFGAFSGTNRMLSDIDIDKYTVENGDILIAMESTVALNEIYQLDYAIECDLVHGIADSKNTGIPVSESLGDKLKSVGDKLSNLWGKIKKFFIELKDKIIAWFKKAKDKFKEWRKKVSEFFKRTKGHITITVDGEDITVTRTDIEAKYTEASNTKKDLSNTKKELNNTREDLANAEHDRDAFARRANDFQQQAARARSDANMYKGQMTANRKRYERAEQEFADADKRAATRVKRFKYTMYEYTGVEEFGSEAASAIAELESEGSITGQYVDDIEEAVNAVTSKVITNNPETNKRRLEVAKGVRAGTDYVIKGICEIFGVSVGSPDEVESAAWSMFRDGATKDGNGRKKVDDISRYRSGDLYEQLVKDHNMLGGFIKQFEQIESAYDRVFSDVIKRIGEWENKVKNAADEGGVAKAELSSALSGYTSAFSTAQSCMNKFIRAWMDAVKEWDASILTLCGGSLA